MEKIYGILILAVLFSAQVTASAQSTVSEVKDLVGTWDMDAHHILGDMGNAEKTAFDSLPGFQRERLVSSLASRVFKFHVNGDFSASWETHGKSVSAQGTWTLQGDGKLRIAFPDEVSEYRASFTSTDRLKLERLNSTGGMVNNLFFIKSGEQ